MLTLEGKIRSLGRAFTKSRNAFRQEGGLSPDATAATLPLRNTDTARCAEDFSRPAVLSKRSERDSRTVP